MEELQLAVRDRAMQTNILALNTSESMKQISNNTQQNCTAVEQVTAATQENTAGTESLAEIVNQIRV